MTPGASKWKQLYALALKEDNPVRLRPRLLAAEVAMTSAAQAMLNSSDDLEADYQELMTAMRELYEPPICGRLVRRGILIEQNSHHSRVGSALLLGNCLSVSVHRALYSRMPQQFLLHLDVSTRTSQHRRVRVSKRMPTNLSDSSP